MPSFIPLGLNYVNVRRRQGILSDYEIVVSKNMCLSEFMIIDDFVQVNVKNFGQAHPQNYTSEVYIVLLLENRNTYICTGITITPLLINNVVYTGAPVFIPFTSIAGILPNGSLSDIYAFTDIINKQITHKYTVNYSVYALWYYIKNCQFPPHPYSGGGSDALGGDSFLSL